jgi:antitoxin (DNA-binding transcriptional repressor) of toxin-antitoxin stability system
MAISNGYLGTMKIGVAEAKNELTKLIKAVENGEQVTICRRGVPVVDLVRSTTPAGRAPKFGTMRDKIIIHDPDWWKPMADEEVDAMLEERD